MHRLLPVDDLTTYRGHPLAWWLLALFTLVTIGRSLVHVLLPDVGAGVIATIPLGQMTDAGARAVVFVFGVWGLSQLLLGIVQAAVVLRYRAFVPAVWVLIAVEYLGRLGLGHWKPLPTIDTPPGAVANLVMPIVAIVMLWLSLRETGAGGRDGPGGREGAA